MKLDLPMYDIAWGVALGLILYDFVTCLWKAITAMVVSSLLGPKE